MARPWYAFYPADYGRDTGHLTLVEHGAYRVLMDHYYATAAALPPDTDRLLRLCRAKRQAERKAVHFVLTEFFDAASDGYHHRRIDAEIEKAAGMSTRGAFAGRISAARRKDTALIGEEETTQSQPSQSQPQSQDNISDTDGFEEFWAAYPRKEAKGPARKAFVRAAQDVAAASLIAAAQAYAVRREGQDRQFTKLAATWLAQECWLDDVAGGGVSDADMRAAWAGRAAPLVDEIGAAAFQAYFREAQFSAGPPARIAVGAVFLRELIARKFWPAIRRAYGECLLEVAA